MNLADLKKPFAPDKISWRVGSTNADKSKGMALAYIDARDVQDRLDEVCGVEGWQCRYVPMHDKKTVCEIGIRIVRGGGALLGAPNLPNIVEWLWKADGAGDSDIEAEKGALSDAFKRSAVRWGIGRYLYDLDSPWVALEPSGRSFKIAAHEYTRLEGILAKSAPKPSAAISHNAGQPNEDPDGQVRAWCDKEIAKFGDWKRLPEALMWEDERASEINRLMRKAPTEHRRLMDTFQRRKDFLTKEGN